LCASNTNPKTLRSTSVEAQFINEVMLGSRSKRKILILDCCHSGAFLREKIKAGDEFPIETFFPKWEGRAVLTASGTSEFAFESKENLGSGVCSVFTRHLTQGLRTGEADRDRNGVITLDEIFEYTYSRVVNERPEQKPQTSYFNVENVIPIAKSPRPKVENIIERLHTFEEYEQCIKRISWSPDGSTLAFAFEDKDEDKLNAKNLRILEKQNWGLRNALAHSSGHYICVAWSPDSEKLAAATDTGLISIWNAQSGELLKTYQSTSNSAIATLAWSIDGIILAAGTERATIELWDTTSDQQPTILEHHTGWVDSLMWSPDGTLLASSSEDKTIKIWNRESATVTYTLIGHTDAVRYVAWSPDGHLLASSAEDKTIRIWESATDNQVQIIEDHSHKVNSVSFSYNGQLLAAISEKEIQIYRCDTWETAIIIPESGCSSWVPNVAFYPNLPFLAAPNSQATSLCIWSLDFEAIQQLEGEIIRVNREQA